MNSSIYTKNTIVSSIFSQESQFGFTPVRGKFPGTIGKQAYLPQWPERPCGWTTVLSIKQGTDGIGMMPGVHRLVTDRAYVFPDFDGEWSFDFYEKNVGPVSEVVNSGAPMWSSGRRGRFQTMFRVPDKFWPHLHTQRVADKRENYPEGVKPDGFEMRWTGCQSVIPPSPHPGTGEGYVWLIEPEIGNLHVEAPDALLGWWLNECNPVRAALSVSSTYVPTSRSTSEVHDILMRLKGYRPTLSYEEWRNATAACMAALGKAEGIAEMKAVYPEFDAGEYEGCFEKWKSYQDGKSTTLGTLVAWIREFEPDYLKSNAIEEAEFARIVAEKKKASEQRHGADDVGLAGDQWSPPPGVPIELLPEAMRDAMDAFKVKANVPHEISLQCVLATASFAAQGLADVSTNGVDGIKPLSEDFIGLAPSGCAKSSLFRPLTAPITEFETKRRKERQLEVADFNRKMVRYEKSIKKHDATDWVKEAVARNLSEDDAERIAAEDLQKIEPTKPAEPMGDTLLVQKPTYNAMVEVMKTVPLCGLFTPEGSEFIHGWGFQDPTRAIESATMLTKLWGGEGISRTTGERHEFIGPRPKNSFATAGRSASEKFVSPPTVQLSFFKCDLT